MGFAMKKLTVVFVSACFAGLMLCAGCGGAAPQKKRMNTDEIDREADKSERELDQKGK